MFIQRRLASALPRLMKGFPVVSLTGPRQSGKTTLLRNIFPDFQYVNLENLDWRALATDNPRGFINQFGGKTIIDEAQRVPALFSYLQTHVDEVGQMGQYILSGSQNFLLLEKITQSLAGRVGICRLLPFDKEELNPNGRLAAQTDEQLFKGFYPALYSREVQPTDFYASYVASYIERDVRSITNVQNLNQFRLFMRLCAGRIGQLINLNALANECGISVPTAKAWLSILESSYLAFSLPPYFRNFNKRLVKTSKLYFYDVGLVCYLLGIREVGQIATHPLRGQLFENLVIAERQKEIFHLNSHQSLYFWRDNHGNEIDLLEEVNTQLRLTEIKSSMTFHPDFLRGIRFLEAAATSAIAEREVVYDGHITVMYQNTLLKNWRD
ncbi:MAG: ATP-binding protein [Spirosomataceae bacterium]